jgi:hypothetical protein
MARLRGGRSGSLSGRSADIIVVGVVVFAFQAQL